jgi:putative SOS response-associated peptidase YedK
MMESELEVSLLKWGLRDGAGRIPAPINARVESAAIKPTFRESWDWRRCIIPADGWYEWQTEHGGKQPYFFARVDGEPVYFAGLWTGGTFCMFTTAADGELSTIHHRKPLSLAPAKAKAWLRAPLATADLISLAETAGAFKFHAVSNVVSNWRNDGPQLTEKTDKPPQMELL